MGAATVGVKIVAVWLTHGHLETIAAPRPQFRAHRCPIIGRTRDIRAAERAGSPGANYGINGPERETRPLPPPRRRTELAA